MTLLIYNGSWSGLLTAIFEVYEYKFTEPSIAIQNTTSGTLFGITHEVKSDEGKAKRVSKKLLQKISPKSYRQLYKTFLSEGKGIENTILHYVQYILQNTKNVEHNYSQHDVLEVQQISRKVDREKHRMEAFVRFQLTRDKLYYAIVQPDYNVLPLIVPHFKNRYADQRWLIYDALRKYGIYYDLYTVTEIQIDFKPDLNNEEEVNAVYDESEALYQMLWQQYFKSVNIAARKNIRLHIQHMPKRYWKYLIEKNI